MKNSIIYAIILYALLSFNFQCGKEDMLPMKVQEVSRFEMPIDIFPQKKTYVVGDTIWIEAKLSNTILLDTKNDIQLKLDTVRFNVPLLFKVLNKQALVPDGGFCEFINPGQLSMSTSPGYYDARYNVYWNYNIATILNYGYSDSQYKVKIGIKLKSKGSFYIGLSDSPLTRYAEKTETVQNKYISFKFSATDLNVDVYHSLPKLAENDPYWIGFDVNLINEKKAFIVQVN
jgi:hypothetical protein